MPEVAHALILRCRTCFDQKIEWQGCDAFGTDEGVLIHCRTCKGFIAKTPPISIELSCDLCKEGKDHRHGGDPVVLETKH